jgi:putative transposase
MPWTDHALQKRVRFVADAQTKTETLSALCLRFGISRPTAYKWLARYHQEGLAGLTEHSRRPHTPPTKLHHKWSAQVLACRRKHRTWGSKKVRAFLRQTHPRAALPAPRTIDRWLKRAHLTHPPAPRRRPGANLPRPKLMPAKRPNEVWTVDFKGWFRTADRQRCDPLTVRDLASRFLIGVRLLPKVDEPSVRRAMTAMFRRWGLPRCIRVDNGAPFAGQGPFGLSQLSVWWLRLGIRVDFIRRGKPQDNGAHEQMHRILKAETTLPPAPNRRAQQRRLERWTQLYNHLRPHQALQDRPPATRYRASSRRFLGPPSPHYPSTWLTRHVRPNGWIKWQGLLRFVGRPFARQILGLHLVDDQVTDLYLDNLQIGSLHQADGAGSIRACSYLSAPTYPKL